MYSSTARGLQGTTTAGRMRSDQVAVAASPSGDYGNSRGLQARCKDKLPTRLSLATRDSESFEGITDSKMSESRLATPSTGDRPSLRASALPLPIGTSHDNAKLRGILPEQRRSMVPKHRP
uniref:Uncharacterized protein n=2 Tax=Octopus bimaculoides TaxID=37653 RepID=A0A0L8GVM1_OCTBM